MKGDVKFVPQFRLSVDGSHRPPVKVEERPGASLRLIPWDRLPKSEPIR